MIKLNRFNDCLYYQKIQHLKQLSKGPEKSQGLYLLVVAGAGFEPTTFRL